MKILIVGANGQIGRHLVDQLSGSEHAVRAMIRNPVQAPALEAKGAEVVVADLESDFRSALEGCDTLIFTAGSGGHTGPEKTIIVDLYGALKMIDAAKDQSVKRFVMVSSMGTEEPEKGRENMRHYFIAKRIADDRLVESGLDYTIVRPGRLTNDDGMRKIWVGEGDHLRQIPRMDVAATIVALLGQENTVGKTFPLLSGEHAIGEALKSI
ncbi:MAG: SDR family oxidoreductase [Planctomycetota bacterium]|nr:SDR family oxidoreductase [Planctomycetota bacterium]